jgi:hypothetical protein
MGDDDAGSYTCVRRGITWEISASSSQFCCEPKTVVKIKLLTTPVLKFLVSWSLNLKLRVFLVTFS